MKNKREKERKRIPRLQGRFDPATSVSNTRFTNRNARDQPVPINGTDPPPTSLPIFASAEKIAFAYHQVRTPNRTPEFAEPADVHRSTSAFV